MNKYPDFERDDQKNSFLDLNQESLTDEEWEREQDERRMQELHEVEEIKREERASE